MKKNLPSKAIWLKVMRLSFAQLTLMVCFTSLTYAVESNAQLLEKKVSVQVNNSPITTVLQRLEEQTEIKFVFSQQVIKASQRISVNFRKEPFGEVLDKMLLPLRIKYEVSGKYILLSDADDQASSAVVIPLNIPVIAPPADMTVTGTVTGEEGTGLPGVSVVLKGTQKGTTTDQEGRFSIAVPGPESVLVFSFVGYLPKEIAVGTQSNLSVKLEVDNKMLEQVVVVGYGTQQKVNLTGAVGVADSKRLENRPIANAGEGLQGVIPNLNVTVRNGDPSQPTQFNIRGYESINGGSPLILVDNVPMDINRINPNDIESISVLKDAAAAAVYGARAAFGVVLVTTKSGKAGKISVNFGSQFSLAKPIFNMDVVTDPYEFVQARNLAAVRTLGRPDFDPRFVEAVKTYSENPIPANEWGVVNGNLEYYGYNAYQDKIMIDYAPTNQQDLSISGGSDKSRFFVSLGRYSKDGYLRMNNEQFKRYNLLVKADFQVNKWLNLSNKVVFNSQNSNKPHYYGPGANINTLARVNPITPIQFPDLPYYVTPGDHEQYEQYIGTYFGGQNFFPYLRDGGRETFTKNDVWLTQGVTLTPFQGFKVVSSFSYNLYNQMNQDVQSKIEVVSTDLLSKQPISNEFSGDDWIENRNIFNQYYVLNAHAEYTVPTIGKHNLTAMVGFNQERGFNQNVYARARQLITPQVTDLNATTGVQESDGGKSHVALRGVFYRLTYNYDDRYLFEANGRYDGTSRFPQDSRFGFFPSFSAGWRISNESFLANTNNWLDNLKIRASYGTLGNQLLGTNYYPYVSTMGTDQSRLYVYRQPYSDGFGRWAGQSGSYLGVGDLPEPRFGHHSVQEPPGYVFRCIYPRYEGYADAGQLPRCPRYEFSPGECRRPKNQRVGVGTDLARQV